jgi:glycosyltransferase involved in cell wall biosynthesis
MKIVFFTENTHCGGLDTVIITLINNWPNDEDKLCLICNRNHPGIETIEKRLIRPCRVMSHNLPIHSEVIRRIDFVGKIYGVGRLLSFFLRYTLFCYYLIAVRKLWEKDDPDRLMVIAGGYPGGDTCRSAVIVWGVSGRKPRAIFSFHNLAVKPNWYVRYIEYIIDWMVAHFSKQLITVSKAAAKSMELRPVIARKRTISYVYNGIDVAAFSIPPNNASLKKELGISPSSRICLKLATYEQRKGHEFLLRSFKKVIEKMPSAHLVICGYGRPEEVERVHNLVNDLCLESNVHLFGFRNDVSYLLENADVLVMASQEYESFGLTCVEAMAQKVPVVATRMGGLPEVIKDGEGGFCVPPDDVEGYARKILVLLENEGLRKEQGEKGYGRYKELFTAKRMACEYAQLIYQNS